MSNSRTVINQFGFLSVICRCFLSRVKIYAILNLVKWRSRGLACVDWTFGQNGEEGLGIEVNIFLRNYGDSAQVLVLT